MSILENEKESLQPILKWAGGKRQLLAAILPRVPPSFDLYAEPFLGGGAVLFRLRPERAIVSDANAELINLYTVIRDDVDALIDALRGHRNDAGYYYAVRNIDRNPPAYAEMTPVERASRTLYLNKHCYNGLYRVNSRGHFNTPFGRYRNPAVARADELHALSAYLRNADIDIRLGDYAAVCRTVPSGAFVYLDPPYHPVSGTAKFTGYTAGGFGPAEQERLKLACDDLTRRGIRFLLSNSRDEFILDLYREYHIDVVKARRPVNSAAGGRGEVDEVLVRNY
ncbi:MAG: DNA adenine methylase [Planctomycetaceae bacterium]|nr:DNA adenine methylase [Planctomycetaceae bacterium]